ncbi:response regulator [Bacteroidota bacterium]
MSYILGISIRINDLYNGKDAITKYFETDYNLIIMDIRMPLMDGIEATKHIRKIEVDNKRDKVKIVGATASEHKEVCLDSGMNDYFHKTTLISHMKMMLSSVSIT